MSPTRLELKVGLFVFAGLSLLAALVLLFTKGVSPLQQTYLLHLRTPNVGFIIPGAAVRMAGVPVGNVKDVRLAEDGKSVVIGLQIEKRYRIHRDARFVIEQIGFLGDQFISIIPQKNQAPLLQPGEEITCDEPFNLQEVARSAVGLIRRVDQTVTKLDRSVDRVDQILLAEDTLSNLTNAVGNLRLLAERAFDTVDSFEQIVVTNAAPVSQVVSNVADLSANLNRLAEDLHAILHTNRSNVTGTLNNLESASASVNALLEDLQAGKGFAGFLLKDEQTKDQMHALMNNLLTLSSNLNRYGLLYKPKRSRTAVEPGESLYTGRRP